MEEVKTKNSLSPKTIQATCGTHELKTKNAKRKIPIHNVLQYLGLIQYMQSISMKSKRLFPCLTKTERSPKYGKQVGKQFSAWIAKMGITGKKSFHSLRHTFSDFFKMKDMHTPIFTQIFRHEQNSLAMRQYGNTFSVRQCHDEFIGILHYSGEPSGGQP